MTRRNVCTDSLMDIILFLTMLLFSVCTGGKSGKPITCEAGHFVLGQNGSVTCHFSHDMKGSKRHIYVVLYPIHAPDSFSGHDILRCSGLNLQKPICRVADGYQFNSDISDRLTVTILEVKNTSAGLYVCQLVPPDDRPVHGCNLTVTGTFETETTPVLTTRPKGVNTVSVSDNINVQSIVVYFALSAVIVALLGFILYNHLKQKRKNRKHNTESADCETPARQRMLPPHCEQGAQTGKSLEKLVNCSIQKIEAAISKSSLNIVSKKKENTQNQTA